MPSPARDSCDALIARRSRRNTCLQLAENICSVTQGTCSSTGRETGPLGRQRVRPLSAAGPNHANDEAVVFDDIAITIGLCLETGPKLPMRAGSSGGCRIVKRRYRTAADFLPLQPTPEIKGWAPTPVRSDVEFAYSTSRNPASVCDTVLRLRLTASRQAEDTTDRNRSPLTLSDR